MTLNAYKQAQAANLLKMNYATIHSSNYQTASSLAANLYKTANDIYMSMLEIKQAVDDNSVDNEAVIELMNTNIDKFSKILTAESSIATLRNYLTNNRILAKATESETDPIDGDTTNVPPTTSTTGTNSQAAAVVLPALDGNAKYDLGKSCPHFSGRPDEDVSRWLLIVKNDGP